MKYPFYKQLDSKDCGPSCLRMIAQFYGKYIDAFTAKHFCGQYRNGTTMYTISQGAKSLGFSTTGVRLTQDQFFTSAFFPCVVQWKKNHFVVVWDVNDSYVKVGDPAIGILNYKISDFLNGWLSHTNHTGIPCGVALLIRKTNNFSTCTLSDHKNKYTTLNYLSFLSPYKSLIFQLIISLGIGSVISLVFPFLAQSIVDIGIQNKDTNFIINILIAQLALSVGMCLNRFIGSWLALHVSSRVSISMVGFFLEKLMKMQISFFDTKRIGDLLLRIQDFGRIETFLTSYLISILMAIVGILVYSIVLFRYGSLLLIVFFAGSIAYLVWIYAFKQQRKKNRLYEISTN